MPQRPKEPSHPGAFVRERVIPSGMSVTEAAKRLGVGRPALSNLLNGKSSLSPEMAVRLEKAFGADGEKLLARQAAFDRHGRREEEKRIAVAPHVPDFLTVTARQIQDWADGNIEARRLLPVLLRKLIHSTGHELRRVDFPGYDNAERKGWDGWVEAGAATPWIPAGRSGWEFGTNQDPLRKADKDYAARIASVSPAERAECAFVFVTPRNWPGKEKWAASKRAAGDWKEVRAFDASDLEQWLDGSIPARMWLAGKLGLPVNGFETPDACWRRWAGASEPEMTPAIFAPSLAAHRDAFREWLKQPPDRLFKVAADSRGEALAFLSCLFEEDGLDARWRDLAAVFDSAETLRKLAASNAPFLPIVHTDAVERELAAVYRQRHCIAVRPRNAVDSEPDIALDLLDYKAFETALAEMGIEGDEADRLARESGRSPTILRRRLPTIPAIRTPEWAGDPEIARGLIPMALVGAWHVDSRADREVVSFQGNGGYERIEESIAQLLQREDCPVWSVGRYRGVASKIDALFAVGGYVTGKDLDDFFLLAKHVLSETDPALDSPESKRWSAAPYGKVRGHSAALREGVCETLVLLSVHGDHLFRDRLGIDVEARVSLLVRNLLTPLTLDKLLSHEKDLPRYAEAAPKEFLDLIEADLQRPEPAVLGLLKPVMFGRCSRAGLLWALECLAWKHLGRVSMVLAQLSRTVIDDNWANKPISSLESIYRSWMPQTAASLEERMQSLETLTKRFPDIGWEICIAQVNTRSQVGHYSYRPHWRADASGAGRLVTWKEIHAFQRKALDLMLAWPEHDQKTLGDLVERVQTMPDDDQARVWDLVDAWAASETDAEARAGLRERIRRFTFTHRGRRDLDAGTGDRARAAHAKLEPGDPVVRHAWLFAGYWIDFSADEIEDGKPDHERRAERIRRLRNEAIGEIWAESGFEGVTTLLSRDIVADVVGNSLTSVFADTRARAEFLQRCLSGAGDVEKQVDGCISGFLLSIGGEEREAVLSKAIEDADTDGTARLLRCAPFGQSTWRLLDRFDAEIRDRYWREVAPQWNRHGDAELNELIDRLLEAKRPRAAFHAVHLDWSRIETSRLKRLLSDAGSVDSEPENHYRLESYQISEALGSLDGRAGVTPDEMARLEFMYIDALDWREHGIPNLERHIAESPMSFVQALALVFKRKDGGGDPSEWGSGHLKSHAELASAAFKLLHRINHIPGTAEDGKIDSEALFSWVTEARRLCAEFGRAEIGDQYIGQLLSKAPAEEDGPWPCLPVCEAMEKVASRDIGVGFSMGVCNSRGMTSRAFGEGGAQERALAAKYRNWSERRAFDYPFVSSVLESIAAGYDWEADREDDEANVEKRLGY